MKSRALCVVMQLPSTALIAQDITNSDGLRRCGHALGGPSPQRDKMDSVIASVPVGGGGPLRRGLVALTLTRQ